MRYNRLYSTIQTLSVTLFFCFVAFSLLRRLLIRQSCTDLGGESIQLPGCHLEDGSLRATRAGTDCRGRREWT
jgi:hypothetical protein